MKQWALLTVLLHFASAANKKTVYPSGCCFFKSFENPHHLMVRTADDEQQCFTEGKFSANSILFIPNKTMMDQGLTQCVLGLDFPDKLVASFVTRVLKKREKEEQVLSIIKNE